MSSGSESDEDYVPGEPEKLSEEESADEETDLQYEKELEQKSLKRKSGETSKIKKKRRITTVGQSSEKKSETLEPEGPLDPEVEKKREEDLWAKFLEGTGTTPKSNTKQETNVDSKIHKENNSKKNNTPVQIKTKDDEDTREQRIFEFAGETIVVENNIIKEKIKTDSASVNKPGVSTPKGQNPGGLSNLLSQLNKKNKLSTLEKSKLDWDTYKKDEGIEEEIQSHNKGKHGYLDRRDFLERADHRQYEIERDLRMSRRSHRH